MNEFLNTWYGVPLIFGFGATVFFTALAIVVNSIVDRLEEENPDPDIQPNTPPPPPKK